MRYGGLGVAALWLFMSLQAAIAAETIRVGVLKHGTVNWEMDVVKTHGLDTKNGINIELIQFASKGATIIALQAGNVDIVVSDWLFVSRQRHAGDDITFVPFSTAVGAIMVPKDSPIKTLSDLNGKKVGVAGGPLDKSWLFVQGAVELEYGIDLAETVQPVFGAPPLLTVKAEQGELDAVLNFWHYCARLEARGFRRLYDVQNAAKTLGAKGAVATIGYVFRERWAKKHPNLAMGFVKASRDAKAILVTSDAEWDRLSDLTQASGGELIRLRDRFRQGIPTRPVAHDQADAEKLFSLLAKLGGERLVGPATALAKGTFWKDPAHVQ